MGAKKQYLRSIRWDDDERDAVQRAADASGMTFAQFVRHRALAQAQAASEAVQLATSVPLQGRTANPPAPAAPVAAEPPRVQLAAYSLDDLGDDPLRGGRRSSRR